MNAAPLSHLAALPTTVILPKEYPSTLACGTHLKNTICALKENEARISTIHANLEDEPEHRAFCEAIAEMQQWLGGHAEVIACDLHPDYLSTKVATRIAEGFPDAQLIGVQHHHAHVVSCMTEHGLEGPVIGIALDGTGHGLDGTIWGGEILIAEKSLFHRAAHIQPVPLPGGARAVLEPWRVGLSYLHQAFGREVHNIGIDIVTQREEGTVDLIIRMIDRGINSPLTSSCGRLFDGVAAILGVCARVRSEGEAAVELERLTATECDVDGPRYSFALNHRENSTTIDPTPMMFELVRDCRDHIDVGECSRRFHNGLIHTIAKSVEIIAERTGIRTIVFSGGCFLNQHLRNGLRSLLELDGFSVFIPLQLPVGDAGVSLGQAVVAASVFQHQRNESLPVARGGVCYPM